MRNWHQMKYIRGNSILQMKKKIPNHAKNGNILARATSSAFAGAPISFVLNIAIVIPLTLFLTDMNVDWWIIAAFIAVPFIIASIIRMFLIDWVWFKFNINIDTKHVITQLYRKLLTTGHF